jgi:hypothetical protein
VLALLLVLSDGLLIYLGVRQEPHAEPTVFQVPDLPAADGVIQGKYEQIE